MRFVSVWGTTLLSGSPHRTSRLFRLMSIRATRSAY
nr:MAG TPA: Small acidic protein family [Caudoviricetes sp.]DAQ02190.1 MAG TPA: Small acidic protein family [Caudoviricetes sp.]